MNGGLNTFDRQREAAASRPAIASSVDCEQAARRRGRCRVRSRSRSIGPAAIRPGTSGIAPVRTQTRVRDLLALAGRREAPTTTMPAAARQAGDQPAHRSAIGPVARSRSARPSASGIIAGDRHQTAERPVAIGRPDCRQSGATRKGAATATPSGNARSRSEVAGPRRRGATRRR